MTRCKKCKRPLRSEVSIIIGYGPTCLRKKKEEAERRKNKSLKEFK